MTLQCFNRCDRPEYQVKWDGSWEERWQGHSPYAKEGVKRCRVCDKYIQTLLPAELRCPCCHGKLSSGSRHMMKKRRLKVKLQPKLIKRY